MVRGSGTAVPNFTSYIAVQQTFVLRLVLNNELFSGLNELIGGILQAEKRLMGRCKVQVRRWSTQAIYIIKLRNIST